MDTNEKTPRDGGEQNGEKKPHHKHHRRRPRSSADMDKIYAIDANGVVLDDQSNAATFTTREKIAIDYEDEFITITKDGKMWYDLDKEIETIVIAEAGKKLADTKKSTSNKAADVKKAIAAADYVNFVTGTWQDGVLVYILSAKPAEAPADPTEAGEINAAWAVGEDVDAFEFDAIATIDTTDAKINKETVVLYDSELGMGETALIADQNATTAAAIDVDVTTIAKAQWRAANYYEYETIEGYAYDVVAKWTAAGTFEFSIYDTETSKLMNFKPGQYVFDLQFTDVNGGTFTVRVDFIVD